VKYSNGNSMTRSTVTSRDQRRRMLAAFWLLWSVALLTVYYKQLWRLFIVGPSTWVADNYSLTFVRALRRLVAAGPLAWGLPALGEALARALAAVFGAGLVLLAAQVLGMGMCRLLRWYPEDWREGLLYRTAIGLGAISYLSLGLAALGLYYAVNVQILIAVVLLGGGLWLVYSQVRCGFSGQQVEALTQPASIGHYRAGDKVWQAIVLLAVLIAFVGALAPEIEYDALWYHLQLPKLWLEQGHPVDLVAEYISLYPLTWELIFGAGMVWGGPVAAKLLHFTCLPLTGLLTYQLTRRFMPLASPWLAVALFVTVPTVLWEATTTYIDLALALHTGLIVYALLRYVEGRRWQWLALAVLNLGLALATKHLGLFVLAITTTGLALRLWIEDRSLHRALVLAVLLGLLSLLLLPLPWYLRSWFASGNPFFPDLYNIFGAFPPERWNNISEYGLANFKNHFGDPRTPLNLLLLPWNMTVHAARYGGTLGPMFLLLLPALVLRRRAEVTSWLLAFVWVYIALWASPVSSFQMRFLAPITPLLAVLAAEAGDRLALLLRSTLVRWGGRAFQGGMAVLLLLNLPPFTSLHEGDRVVWDGWLTHVIHRVPISVVIGKETQEEYLIRSLPSYAAWRHINTHLPADARVLTFSGGDHFYSERDRIASDATIAHTAVWGTPRGQEQRALRVMRQLDISYVFVDRRQLESGKLDDLAIFQPEIITDLYELVYEDNRFILFRVR
jgi:hypothetical protein